MRYFDWKTFRKIYVLMKLKNIYWSNLLCNSSIDLTKVRSDKKSSGIYLDDFDIVISKLDHEFFLKGYHYAKTLRDAVGAEFSIGRSNEILVELCGIKLHVQTSEELYILNEIFVENIYNIVITGKNPLLIWDIGMNVGFSSLFFAAKYTNCLIVSYEPFTQTYDRAMANFSLNPYLSDRINAQNAGIGSSNKELSVEYCSEYKGSIGVSGVPKRLTNQNIKISREDILIIEANEVLESIVSEYPNRDIIAKIDCEGSEYEILECLFESDQLQNINVIMLEWHYDGPQKIEELLKKSGYLLFSFKPYNSGTGMIYAIRRNPVEKVI